MKHLSRLGILLPIVILTTVSFSIAAGFDITFNTSNYEGGYNIRCHGGNDGSIEAIPISDDHPFFYQWSNGATTKAISNLHAGAYTVTVTNFNSVTATAVIELLEPSASVHVTPEPKVYEGGTNISATGEDDGAIGARVEGGNSPYAYLWSNGSTREEIDQLVAGSYSVIVTDESGCTTSGSVTLTEPTPLHIISITSPLHHGYNISCKKYEDGAINLVVTGGAPFEKDGITYYDYKWNNGLENQNLEKLGPGHYMVRVRDANGAEVGAQITLTEPESLDFGLQVSVYQNGYNVSCYDCSNGSLDATATGGVSPYTYLWSCGETIASIDDKNGGYYSLTVTDANGCETRGETSLTKPDRADWTMLGNTGSDPSTQFLGTKDNTDFVFRTNDTERLRIKGNGTVEFKNSVKIASESTDSSRSVFVDQNGMLKVNPGSGTVYHPCARITDKWFTNYCYSPNDIYTSGNVSIGGNVGIGTMAPTKKLDVVGEVKISSLINGGIVKADATGVLSVTNGLSNQVLTASGWRDPQGLGQWQSIGTNNIYYDNGNVGIGSTNNPSEKLEVHGGNILIKDGNLNIGGADLRLGSNDQRDHYGSDYVALSHMWSPSGAPGPDKLVVNVGGSFSGGTTVEGSNLTVNALNGGNGIVTADNDGMLHKITFSSAHHSDVLLGDGTWGTSLLNNANLWQEDANHNLFPASSSGRVTIGCGGICANSSNYKLAVNGHIIATEVKVKLFSGWSDFVFDKEYKLTSLNELENFIKKNKHLPDIPSSEEVEKDNGINLGEIDAKLLQKIEELTLYMIDLKKENERLNGRLTKLEKYGK